MNPPTSFKTNVNRAKTKRWVEAKSYSYDGDDWGEADDYDEYNGYDEPTPPARPTGFRQPGQAVDSPSSIGQGGNVDSAGGRDYRRRDYGDLSAQSTGPRTQDAARSMTNPAAPSTFSHDRVNSFDRNDEQRSFSAGGMPSSYAMDYATADPTTTTQGGREEHQPSTRFSQMGLGVPPGNMSAVDRPWHQSARQGDYVAPSLQVQTQFPTYGDRPATEQVMSPVTVSQTPMHREPPQYGNTGSRTHSMTNTTPAMDLQHRRDFSPSALPPPLHPRASPVPQSAKDESSAMRFPPRKSSLSQQNSPYTQNSATTAQGSYFSNDEPSSAGVAQAEAVSPSRDRSGSNTTKPLPFVRPADIYKRMEEEREKARRSQESGRPSMDSIAGRPVGEVPGSATESSRDVLLSGDQGKSVRRRSSMESTEGDDVNRRLKPALDPVVERKSEYGFDGFHENVQPPTQRDTSASSGPSEGPAGDRALKSDTISTYQDSPVLPSVLRVSGFGDDFMMKDTTHPTDCFNPDRDVPAHATEAVADAQHLSPNGHDETEQSLQHQTSLGFRSVVNQAFDRPEDRSVPPTPSSTGESGVARTNSESTTGVSPIMSRVPSAATAEAKARAVGARDVAAPSIAEEVNETSLTPTSSGIAGTPQQFSQTPPPLQPAQRDSAEVLPHAFRPGHRRDLSTPSPGNSPARSPAVEAIHGLPSAEQVEMASATPVDTKPVGNVDWPRASDKNRNSRFDYTTREADLASSVNTSPVRATSSVADIASETQSSFLDSRRNNALGFQRQSRPESPISRNESPTKGKVRNLADKFEAESSSRRGSVASITSKAAMPSGNVRNGGDLTPPRPLTDRSASFRPKLPGGWESYAPTSGESGSEKELGDPDEHLEESRTKTVLNEEPVVSATTPTSAQNLEQHPENDDLDITPTTVKRSLSMAQVESPKDPLTAVAAAGSALAGAIAAAVGLEYDNPQTSADSEATGEPHHTANAEEFGAARGKSMAINTGELPLEGSDSSLPDEQRRTLSGLPNASPTPSAKVLSPADHAPSQPSDNLSSMAEWDQGPAEPAYIYERPVRPQMLPSLSTESGPLDYESDRLRKEIVRSLSPRTSRVVSGSRTIGNMQDTDENGSSTVPFSMGQGRESAILPKEYESYWNGSSDEDEAPDQSHHHQIEPLQTDEPEASLGHQDQADLLPRRFSWEQDTPEASTTVPAPVQYTQQQEDPGQSIDYFAGAGPHLAQAQFGHLPSRSADETDNATKAPVGSLRNLAEADVNEGQEHTKEQPDVSKEIVAAPLDREATPVPAVVDHAFVEKTPAGLGGKDNSIHDEVPEYEGGLEIARPSIDKEPSSGSDRQSFGKSAPGNLTPESPIDRSGQPRFQDALGPISIESKRLSGPSPSPAPARQSKIVTFREILTLKSPAERIQAYNNTREQFSDMDTGLNHWITTTINALPEHADLLSRGGKFDPASIGHRPSPSRGKLLRTSPTSATMQQPYYQQYLNASSQPAASSSGSTLPTPSGSGSQGFSPSGAGGGARQTSQQVQAKGKDLLHSAGLLGGKANVAAKGLFSKGKSKLRGSGGVEKDVSRSSSQRSQPHLDGTPPPYLDLERQSSSSRSVSTGSRPVTVFDDPYRKRPFSTVLPERPSSYAPYNDFDLPPSTPPDRESRRLGVLPSPTVDATPTRYNNAKEAADGDNVSEKAIGMDDSTAIRQDVARLEMLEPPALGDSSGEHSSSRSSPVQDNPAMVGDVPVYLETSASSQVSTLSSEVRAEGTATEEELVTPRQSTFSGPMEHRSSFDSTPPVPKNTQDTLSQSNGYLRGSQLEKQSSPLDVQSALSQNPNGPNGDTTSIVAHQVRTMDENSITSVDSDVHAGIPRQTKALPQASGGQGPSQHHADAEAPVFSPAAVVADPWQGSRNLSATPASGMLASDWPSQIQDKQPRYATERNVSPLPVVADPAATSAAENTPLGNGADSGPDSSRKHDPYETSHSSTNGSRPGARLRSDSPKTRSPDVSPERQYQAVLDESDIPQQSRTSPAHERVPSNQSQTSNQGQSRPFSFVQNNADAQTVPYQDQVLREQQWEPGYKNGLLDPLQDGRSSFNTRQERSTPWDPSSQQESYRLPRDEMLRHSSTVPYRQQPSRSGSSYDPNIREHPAYRQRQQPVAQDLPSNYYPAETRREEGLLPRHQGTEYQLTGIGPPQAEQYQQKRRSSSRSSNFFKGLGGRSPSRTDVPKMPSIGGRTTSDEPGSSNQLNKRVSKRTSLFRSFTQRRGSDSGRSNDSIVAQAPGSRTDLLQQSGPMTPRPLQDTTGSGRNPEESQSNSLRKRMQRRSTPGDVEPENGKKKRFSLRNLFARFGSTKRSPSVSPSPEAHFSPPIRPTQRPSLQPQQSSAYFSQSTQPYVPPPDRAVPQNEEAGPPPPLGGYYAPEIRSKPKSSFVGGRRLSEQQVGEARHRFESQTGFRGPYHGSSTDSRTPDTRYQDTSIPSGPSASQYAMPPVATDRPNQYSNYGGDPGITGVQRSQPPSQYTQNTPYNQWTGQPESNPARPLDPPEHQVSPQVSRPDLQTKYNTPPPNRPSSSTTTQPTNPTQSPRPYTHNFSRHHRVDSPYGAREDSPQARPAASPSRPNGPTHASTPPRNAYPPAVPPKDNPLPRHPGNRPPKPAPAQNLISHLSSRAVAASPQPQARTRTAPRSRNVDYGGSGLEVAEHQRSGGGRGQMAEMDGGGVGSGRREEEEEEEIVMSSTAYPGQEWAPSNYGHWEDD